jgi:hypothetical protein
MIGIPCIVKHVAFGLLLLPRKIEGSIVQFEGRGAENEEASVVCHARSYQAPFKPVREVSIAVIVVSTVNFTSRCVISDI